MGFLTPAGKELATHVWAVLDSAGFKGLDEGESSTPISDGGYRMVGHGDKVEVSYAADAELFQFSWEEGAHEPGHHGHRYLLMRRQFETVMLGAIAQILIADGVGFTLQPATDQRSTILLVHSMSAPL